MGGGGVSGRDVMTTGMIGMHGSVASNMACDGCDLLIAADCTAYAYGNFHADFIRGRVTLIGCPKLDTADYEEKLTAILTENDVRSVMLTRMEVPCCGGLEYAARQAIAHSGRALPLRVVTISAEGRILQEQTT